MRIRSKKDAELMGLDPESLGFPGEPTRAQERERGRKLKANPKAKAKHKPKPPLVFRPIPIGAIVAGIDPSSSACGVAFLRQESYQSREPQLLGFEVIRPKMSLPVMRRIDFIVDRVAELFDKYPCHVAVIEWANLARWHGGDRVGQMAPVLLAQSAVREAIRRKVFWVEEYSSNTWTGGVQKSKRAQEVRARFPDYAACHRQGGDPGMDGADAAGLVIWRLGR